VIPVIAYFIAASLSCLHKYDTVRIVIVKERRVTKDSLAGRPRDARATETILRAAMELGSELGFDALTIEGIAARAGVGKTTIYRRWPNVWAIVVEAVMDEVTQISPVLERATARESFAASMKLVAKSFRGKTGKLLRPLIGRAQVDDGLRVAISERWLARRRKLSRQLVLRGIANGELRAGLDPDIVLDALYGPLYHRLLLPYDGTDVKLSDTYVDALIDVVFGGVERRAR
jgi:AcrR family transcriptional regulator